MMPFNDLTRNTSDKILNTKTPCDRALFYY